ncbi:unnamed protein product, partial [Prorocentrum cordatum]
MPEGALGRLRLLPATPEGTPERLRVLSRHVLASRACSVSEVVPYEKGKHFGILADYEYPIRYSEAGLFSEAQKGYGTWGELLKVLGEQCPSDEVVLAVERPLPKPESPGVAPSLPWK